MTQQYPHRSGPGRSRVRRILDGFRSGLPTRSRHNRVLGGVCGGLARAWGVSPWQVRLAVILLSFLPGPMWAVYALAWVAMPLEGKVWAGS